jgi:hypothetical protein
LLADAPEAEAPASVVKLKLIKGIGAEEPSAYRGPQFHAGGLAAAAQTGLAIGGRGGV